MEAISIWLYHFGDVYDNIFPGPKQPALLQRLYPVGSHQPSGSNFAYDIEHTLHAAGIETLGVREYKEYKIKLLHDVGLGPKQKTKSQQKAKTQRKAKTAKDTYKWNFCPYCKFKLDSDWVCCPKCGICRNPHRPRDARR